MNMMEAITASRRGGTSQQEYLLQGSILDSHCEVLLHRLRGLCDNADTPPETFQDHEILYSLSKLRIESSSIFNFCHLLTPVQEAHRGSR